MAYAYGTTVCFTTIVSPPKLDECNLPGWPAWVDDNHRYVRVVETAYLWCWADGDSAARSLKTVPPSPASPKISEDDHHYQKLCAVFHPSDPDVFFLICMQIGFSKYYGPFLWLKNGRAKTDGKQKPTPPLT